MLVSVAGGLEVDVASDFHDGAAVIYIYIYCYNIIRIPFDMIEKSDLRVWSVMVCEGDGGDGGGACHSLEWTLLIC